MKRVHLYTLPKDTALPTDTSALPDGYPYLVNGVVHHLIKGPNGDGSDDTWEALTPAVHAPAHEVGGGDVVRRTPLNRIAAGSSQTVSTSCSVVGCTAAGITVTLASAMVAEGAWIDVVDESGGAAANPISVTTEGELIDGVSTLTIGADYGALRVYSDGVNWFTR